MVVFSFQSIISIQCSVVLANSIYSANAQILGYVWAIFFTT